MPQHDRAEQADQDGEQHHRRFERGEGDEHDTGSPAAAPGLRRPYPAQHQCPDGGDQQRQRDREDAQREPALVGATQQHRQQRVRDRDPEPQPPVVDQPAGDRVGRQQRERHHTAQQRGAEPLGLPGQHGRAEGDQPQPGRRDLAGRPDNRRDHGMPQVGQLVVRGQQRRRREEAQAEQPAGGDHAGHDRHHGRDHDGAQPRMPWPLVGHRAEVVAGHLVERGRVGVAGHRAIPLGRGAAHRLGRDSQAVPPRRPERTDDLVGPGNGIDLRRPAAQIPDPARVRDEGAEGQHLVERAAGNLADQIRDGMGQAAEHQPEPDQRQHLAGGVTGDDDHAEQPVDLARPATGQPAWPQTRAAHLPVNDQRVRRGHHAIAVEVGPPAELHAVAEHRQRRVEPVEISPDRVRTSMPQVDTPSRDLG